MEEINNKFKSMNKQDAYFIIVTLLYIAWRVKILIAKPLF
jgi:hypothetical protein